MVQSVAGKIDLEPAEPKRIELKDAGPQQGNEVAQLALVLGCDRTQRTILQHRYMAYPLSVSPVFRLDAQDSSAEAHRQKRAYLYRMNTSPGLLAGDKLRITIHLKDNSTLHLADQSATKVHRMPQMETAAQVAYEVQLEAGAGLEFLPEPVILFEDAALLQTTEIVVAPSSGLCWGEIVLPGRWARGECYQFREFTSRVRVRDLDGQLVFAETMKLLGKENRFAQSALFSAAPVLGSLIVRLPVAMATREALAALQQKIDAIASAADVTAASTVLPDGQGVFVRAMAQRSQAMQTCFKEVASAVRQQAGEVPLPYAV